MTRKVKASFVPSGAQETVPGEPAAAHCAGIHTMHPTPGAVLSSYLEQVFSLALSGDIPANTVLTSMALDENPDAQRLMGYLHLARAADPLDCDAALAWFRHAATHRDLRSRLALAGLLMSRAGGGDASALAEAIPHIRALVAQGNAEATTAYEYLKSHGYDHATIDESQQFPQRDMH